MKKRPFLSLITILLAFCALGVNADTQLFSNSCQTTLAADLNQTDTTATLTDGSCFASPAAGEYQMIGIRDSAGVTEIAKGTARSGNTVTITRSQEGTSAPTKFFAGATVATGVIPAIATNWAL